MKSGFEVKLVTLTHVLQKRTLLGYEHMGGGVRDLLRRFRQLKDTFSRAHAADATPPAPPVFSGVPGPDFDLPEGSDILLAAPLDLTLLAAHSGPDEGIRNIAACAPGGSASFRAVHGPCAYNPTVLACERRPSAALGPAH
ncbi:hypothetical protein HaLaN_12439 [Haematococcus lacustris]|uniref:Uncharacterized protein n=1 Tax=Haematococcus lacustris TaxID=44745 RepID=A0A699Z0Q3_HAELA|nr:hypothetical protein HaLaN_12439 [Haematococcus lacustris]